ncbi:hypothetical protein C8Q80DRAFT_1115258 [Daedaleopsis nitida]|nr:hypothetical protein C8Q80DRAFT_1115258 [Daedaleopsis nitida]
MKHQESESEYPVEQARSTRDPDFYYHLRTFEVERTLFRIPQHYLEESEYFRRLLKLGPGDKNVSTDTSLPRESKRTAQVLEEITVQEFRDFLEVLIAAPYHIECKIMATPTSWVSVIKLATRWRFDTLRLIALANIAQGEDCVVRLAVARQYDAKMLLQTALEDVLQREDALRFEEYSTLGVELAANVMRYREEWRRPIEDRVDEKGYKTTLIKRIFGDGFANDVAKGEEELAALTKTKP